MLSLDHLTMRVHALALAALTLLATAALPVVAQDMPATRTPRGGDEGMHRGGRGGIVPGLEIGIGIGEAISRQQDTRSADHPSSKGRRAVATKKTSRGGKKDDKHPPRLPKPNPNVVTDKPTVTDKPHGPTPVAPTPHLATDLPPFIYKPPGPTPDPVPGVPQVPVQQNPNVDCHKCDQLLAAILKLEVQIPKDEETIESYASMLIQMAVSWPLEANELAESINLKQQTVWSEKKTLEDLIAKYKKCMQELAHVCPPKPKRHLAIVQVTGTADELPQTAIDCDGHEGRIIVRTGVDVHWNRIADNVPQDRENMISISYQGTQCDDCRWVQFIWTEAIVHETGKGPQRLSGRIETTGGTYALSENPDYPTYNVDSASTDDPAYDSTGASNVGDNYDTMFDVPGNPFLGDGHNIKPPSIVRDARPRYPKLESVTWNDHFDTFLVCDGRVCAKVSWDVSFTWRPHDTFPDEGPAEVSGPTFSKPTISTDAKPNLGQYQALDMRYGGGG
jgi:hypothetical protein